MKQTKLSLSLSSEEDRLRQVYIEIGKKVHEIYAYGGSLGKFFDEKYEEIVRCENSIQEIRKELEVIKGVKDCPGCGKAVAKSSEFCPGCGFKMTEGPANINRFTDAAAANIIDNPPAAATKKCASCGAENDTKSRFCLGCGRIL